jgi:adenylosuccinate synthase
MKAITKKALNASQCKTGLKSNFCVVLGLQWGYEGKNKLIQKLVPDYDYSCRYNGGVVTEPTLLPGGQKLQMMPTGIVFPSQDVKCILANGVVIDPAAMIQDFEALAQEGIPIRERLYVSDRSNLVTAVHKAVAEKILEIRKSSKPCWLDGEDITSAYKQMKMGLRVNHLMQDWGEFYDKYLRVRDTSAKLFNIEVSDDVVTEDLDRLKVMRDIFVSNECVKDTVLLVNREIKNKKRFLVEDASSTSMDVDTGLYPFTESYHTTTGAVCTGMGVPEEVIETTIGVFSAVSIMRKEFLKRIRDYPTHILETDPAYDKISKNFE